ncbi:MAG: deacylase [Acidobacteria bacterium]|nr:MAG: deacylase [Acidobacteriota bacterium]
MPISSKLKTLLDVNKIRYVVIAHSPAYTAQEVAASAHIKGKDLVKCVIVNSEGEHYMVVTNANQRVNLARFKKALGVTEARLEKEDEFNNIFDDCEPGAMPPFGSLYGVSLVVDEAVYADQEIAFNGGNHSSVVKMAFADFERLAKPRKAAVADPL